MSEICETCQLGKQARHPFPIQTTHVSSKPLEMIHSNHHHVRPPAQFAIFATLVVALGPLSLGFALGFTSPTQAAIIKDLNLTVGQFSTFGSILNVGCMLGAILSGKIADYLGRKRALLVAVVPELVGWILIVFGQNPISLIIARFLVGLGGGIISFTVPMYIGEIAPKHMRGGLGTMNQFAITVGITLSYLLGIWVNWRMLAVLGALPEIILIFGLFLIPESPRWLAKAAHKEELTSSLQKLRGKDFNISHEISDIQAAVEASNSLPAVKWGDLMQPKLFRPLIAGIGLMVLQQFSGINALMLYSSAIFGASGKVSFILVVLTLGAAGLMDKAGRRILLMISAGGMGLSNFLVAFSFYARMSPAFSTFISILALVSLLAYIASFSLGMGAIPWIIMSEIFPAYVKGVAGSVATLVNWFSAYIVTFTFNYMLLWSAAGSFWIFAGECLLTVVFVALYVPETRGRTLEQIEASFK
ncbi:unnamed protein product [Sphagnum troendelagicum]|uniref:Major facilitator superfamily (MFS) profile domain-containing protein n=1 Tax=Sphagnum troendelagicum TaxID=128251 RepID=A0ABP0UF78_9BRYO